MKDGGELVGALEQVGPFVPRLLLRAEDRSRSSGNRLKNSSTNLAFRGKGGPISNPMYNIPYLLFAVCGSMELF